MNFDTVLAHAIGDRDDLPIPLAGALTGAVVALLATFVVLAAAWRTSRFQGLESGRTRVGRPLPPGLARVLDARAFRWALRVLGLAAGGWVAVILVAGPQETADSAAPGVLYVVLWVWVPLVSVLLGPVWRSVSPLRTLHLLLARATGVAPTRGPVALPAWTGYWPAAATLVAFVWLELIPRDRGTVPVVFLAFVVYAVLMLAGGALFGSRWFARADPFEVYSNLAAHLSPVGRRTDGKLVWRNPFHGLDALRPEPGLAAVVVILLGATAFDSMTGHPDWLDLVQGSQNPALVGTLGLAGTLAVIGVAYVVATQAVPGGAVPGGRRELPGRFAHSLLPIALGYQLAHYYSLAIEQGQRTAILAADPLGTGNLLGLSTTEISYALLDPTAVAILQVTAVVAGHIVGAVAAHDRAVRLFPPRLAQRGQLPLLLLMVGYTYLGLSLLFAA